jgi:hypothetical protein
MKALVVALFLLPAFAQAQCTVLEAQVIGTVTASNPLGGRCEIALQLSHASPHVFCPLGVTEGQTVKVVVDAQNGLCAMPGVERGGVMQENIATGELRLDE